MIIIVRKRRLARLQSTTQPTTQADSDSEEEEFYDKTGSIGKYLTKTNELKSAKKWALKTMNKHHADRLAPNIPDNVFIPHKQKKLGAFYSRATAI